MDTGLLYLTNTPINVLDKHPSDPIDDWGAEDNDLSGYDMIMGHSRVWSQRCTCLVVSMGIAGRREKGNVIDTATHTCVAFLEAALISILISSASAAERLACTSTADMSLTRASISTLKGSRNPFMYVAP
jgi:hypothetical protein